MRSAAGPPVRARVLQGWPAAVVFAGCLFLLVRHPRGRPPWHTLWAEDGHVFLQCASQHGIACFARQWDGYLHIAPRLLASLVAALPVGSWAVAASIVAIVVAAAALTVIWAATAWIVPSAPIRAAAVLVAAASTAVQREAVGNLANLHWFFFAAALALAVNPNAGQRLADTVGRGGWLVVTCLSDPFGVVVVAAFAVGVLLRSQRPRLSRADVVLGAALLVAVAVQSLVIVISPRENAGKRVSLPDSVHLYTRLVARDGWVGPRSESSTLALMAGSGFLVVVVAGWMRRRGRRDPRRVAAASALLVASPVFYVAVVMIDHGAAVRYATVPFLLGVLGGAAFMLAACAGWDRGPALVCGLLAALLAGMVAVGPYPTLVSQGGQAWPSAVATARAQCLADHGGTQQLAIAPRPAWTVALSCRRLLGR